MEQSLKKSLSFNMRRSCVMFFFLYISFLISKGLGLHKQVKINDKIKRRLEKPRPQGHPRFQDGGRAWT